MKGKLSFLKQTSFFRLETFETRFTNAVITRRLAEFSYKESRNLNPQGEGYIGFGLWLLTLYIDCLTALALQILQSHPQRNIK